MILGIGIDIIEVARIQASHEKFGERFLNRILHPNEISYCLSTRPRGRSWRRGLRPKRPSPKPSAPALALSLAGRTWRWGAKRAASRLSFCTRPGQKLLQARGARAVLISLSHTQTYAAAVALLESADRSS